MNTKLKLTLLGAAVSCGVLGALGTATFAWFTTQRMVSVRHSSITVGANAKNISVSITTITPVADSRETVAISGASGTFETDARIGDCSSDFGKAFYVPASSGSGYRALNGSEIPGYVYQVGITVTNLAINEEATLQFAASWDVAVANSASYALVENLRCGIIECSSDNFAPPADTTGYRHAWVKRDKETNNKYINQYGEAEIAETAISDCGYYSPMFTYSAGSTHYYLFSAWMEGTINENQDTARGGVIDIITTFDS